MFILGNIRKVFTGLFIKRLHKQNFSISYDTQSKANKLHVSTDMHPYI